MMCAPKEFPGASFDHWLTTNPADAELGPEPEDEPEPETYPCVYCGEPTTHELMQMDDYTGLLESVAVCNAGPKSCTAKIRGEVHRINIDNLKTLIVRTGERE